MIRTISVLVLLIALSPGLKAFSEPGTFPFAAAMRGCTQEDLPALVIVLAGGPYNPDTEPIQPYVRIEVAWDEWKRVKSGQFDLIPLSRHAAGKDKSVVRAQLNLVNRTPEWLRGSLKLTKVEEDAVKGEYSFTGESGHWAGTFSAKLARHRAQCG